MEGFYIYAQFEIKELEKNPTIISASERSISYNPEYKTKDVKKYKKGKSPSQIFIEHGFNLEIIGKEQPKRCLQRWRDTFEYGTPWKRKYRTPFFQATSRGST
ncbi:hypothetical protein P4534_04990 [Peribacillus butanolivorans]|uniref:hypothetical protein n=1 Tax=Peribacillus butanolivorans TaxID=421767 RepID=UPI002E240222|nr:hypothetical protein [Peribacillus butanolivorans]